MPIPAGTALIPYVARFGPHIAQAATPLVAKAMPWLAGGALAGGTAAANWPEDQMGPPSEEELAASRPVSGVMNRRGAVTGFRDIPPPGPAAPAAAAAGVPNTGASMVRGVENRIGPAGLVPGTPRPMATSTPPAQPQDEPFTQYESKNPMSMFDKDIGFTHTLSRMLGMAGLGDKAAGARDLHMKMQMARIDDIGEQAQRAFLAGDITKGIDMFNHAVPTGSQIKGYRVTPSGDYSLQMNDGRVLNKSKQEMLDTLTAYRKPEVISTLMQKRAESMNTMNREMITKAFQQSLDIEKAYAAGVIDLSVKSAIERLKATLGDDYDLKVDSLGQGVFRTNKRSGVVDRIEMAKGTLPGSPPAWRVTGSVPSAVGAPGTPGTVQPTGGTTVGTPVDARGMAERLGLLVGR